MQYKCEICEDTGSISKHLSGSLDCISCEASADRAALEAWLSNNSAMSNQDIAWLVHQRALAMAPKQEAPEQKPVGMVAKSSFASHKVLVATVQLDDVPLGAKLYLSTPAAANGALTDAQVHQGVMALLGCTSSEVEDYSAKLYEGYANDVRRVHAALSGAKGN